MPNVKSVCYFGSYDPNYSRNQINMGGLIENGINIIECRSNGPFVKRYLSLFHKFFKTRDNFSSVIVGFPGWHDLPLAFVLGKIFNKKVIFDVFTPMHETFYMDRKQVRAGWFYKLYDWINFKLSDYVLADTKTHLKVYCKNYGLNKKKGVVIYLGSDDHFFKPISRKETTDILFYGSYQPLQGVEHIINAASYLKDYKFKLIGKGQTKAKIEVLVKEKKLRNILFADWVSVVELADEIARAKIVLGIFGESEKALSVIPNKVYDGIACQKVVVTKKTTASLELFSQKGCILIENDKELIDAIKLYMSNSNLRNKKSVEAFEIYEKNLKPKKVVLPLLKII